MPGETYQSDWNHEIVPINGVTVTVNVAHVRLCHSRMLFARAYPRHLEQAALAQPAAIVAAAHAALGR